MTEMDARRLQDMLERRILAIAGHVNEPGSRPAIPVRDGLAPYGTEDTTGFAPGAVF
jgi:hypothetical protein